jgi:hypothetical protein
MTTWDSTADRVTCPVCGRLDRAVTKKGKIRDHDVPPGYTGGGRSRFCAAGGLTVAEAKSLSLTVGQIRKIRSRDT